jgi:phosphoribosylaminoimidazolecarboxamide formyltransferase/IMP cyclohydrolase
MKIRCAFISVWDKEAVMPLARSLQHYGVRIIASPGTATHLASHGINAESIEKLFSLSPMLGGRVKTLHPYVFAPILASKQNSKHMEELDEVGLKPFDMVVVELYPFERVFQKQVKLDEAIELIDIGGVALVRAAAKNFQSVAVICQQSQYRETIEELEKHNGTLPEEVRRKLAIEAFALTASYDAAIQQYFMRVLGHQASRLNLSFNYLWQPRYGENPHQQAYVYSVPHRMCYALTDAKQHQGKQLSFNNLLDANAALELVMEFEEPTAVIVKHNNACGVSCASTIEEAMENAYNADPKSAFGGIIALNRRCTEKVASFLTSFFNEVVLAPAYSDSALRVLSSKPNVRVLELPLDKVTCDGCSNVLCRYELRQLKGAMLLQERDTVKEDLTKWRVVSAAKPSSEQMKEMLFAWKVCKHLKSNAIVVSKNLTTQGMGMGQTNRVDAARHALERAGKEARNAVLASDGFIPFEDTVQLAAKAGIAAIVEPGGSIRDKEVVRAADEFGIALVFTGTRHFRH